LNIGEARGNHEPVGDGGDLLHPQQNDVPCFAVIAGLGGEQGELLAVVKV